MFLESRFESIETAVCALTDLLGTQRGDEESWYAATSSLREAMANAVRHGGRGTADDQVRVELVVEGAEVMMTVEDRGRGFDVDAVPDPTAPENLLKSCGRGIFTMRRLMDSVVFRHRGGGGTIVQMRRRLTNNDQGEAS